MTFNLDEVREFIRTSSPDSKIYIGGDSERFKSRGVWYADYAIVVVVHINGKNGCKVFGEITREVDYDRKPGRPSIRLMNEVMKVAELYCKLADVIGDRATEIHVDLNSNEKYGSSCVVSQAIGYITGTCNIRPKIKPYAWAASIAADRFKELAA
jgi:predicted RNase H-related nuclease YkuK (DUF458 family)